MKKLYLAVHQNGNITTSSCPIAETGAESKVVDVEDGDYEKAMNPAFKTELSGQTIVNTPIPAPAPVESEMDKLKKRIDVLETLNKK